MHFPVVTKGLFERLENRLYSYRVLAIRERVGNMVEVQKFGRATVLYFNEMT